MDAAVKARKRSASSAGPSAQWAAAQARQLGASDTSAHAAFTVHDGTEDGRGGGGGGGGGGGDGDAVVVVVVVVVNERKEVVDEARLMRAAGAPPAGWSEEVRSPDVDSGSG